MARNVWALVLTVVVLGCQGLAMSNGVDLLFPEDGAAVRSPVVFRWEAVTGAEWYDLFVGPSEYVMDHAPWTFDCFIRTQQLEATVDFSKRQYIPDYLEYVWSVRALDPDREPIAESPPHRFTLRPETVVETGTIHLSILTAWEISPGFVEVKGSALSPEGAVEEVEWDWGDGTQETGSFPRKHWYFSDGVYPLEIRVTDCTGHVWRATEQIFVNTLVDVIPLSQWPNGLVAFTPYPTLLGLVLDVPSGQYTLLNATVWAVSSNGEWIVYSEQQKYYSPLFLTSRELEPVVALPSLLQGTPTLLSPSPDGRFVAYVGSVAADSHADSEGDAVFIWDVRTGANRQLTREYDLAGEVVGICQIQWSADGNRILYVTHGSSPGTIGIYTIGIDGADRLHADLASEIQMWGEFVQLSPDGKWVAYFQMLPESGIAICHPDGSDHRLIARFSTVWPPYGLAWDANSERIAYSITIPPARADGPFCPLSDGGVKGIYVASIHDSEGVLVETSVMPKVLVGWIVDTLPDATAPEAGGTAESVELEIWIENVQGLTITVNGLAVPQGSTTVESPPEWDWGDGASNVSWFPSSHTYGAAGVYTITVFVRTTTGAEQTVRLEAAVK